MAPRARARKPTITLLAALKLIHFGASLGLDRSQLARVAGLDLDRETDREARYPVAKIFEVWAHIARAVQDPAIPVRYVQSSRVEDYDVVGFALLTSRTGREVVERGLRYSRLFDDSGEFVLEAKRHTVHIHFRRNEPLSLGARLSNEVMVGGMLNCVRVIGGSWDPVAVKFRHKAPADTSAHRQFFGCELEFGATDYSLVVPREILDAPRDVNPGLSAFVERQAESLLARAAEPTTEARVRNAVLRALASGEPKAAALAQELGMSERTLRRRLDDEKTTFRELVDTVRRDRAEALLAEGRPSITEIAFLLGFSDPSAFSRAFRRWHQIGPREYRAAERGGAR